ncbi:MAG: M43 family zinc metalloprotease [Chitinophagales bacterium]|nr:M43 family zinc metalloprotease [Chitinophagales bacterium]MDW8428332.1 M43 family zinc metalloprotease [Chitinophagales bacterium]
MRFSFKTLTATLFLFYPLTLVFSAFAQRQCGTDEYLRRLAAADPSWLERWKQSEEVAQQWMQQMQPQTRNTYIIPVVVHVIWKTPSQNITDEQIGSQIEVLNEDFNRLNADTTKTPSPWKSVAGKINIQFCLARYDPYGNETSGIVRVQTNVTAFGMGDSMKFTSKGGSDAWPTNRYLNIWVCNMAGNLLGYATMPSGPNPGPTDGVVIWYRAFGRVGNLSSKYNKGRTTTHEVGHWLGLRHIWGDDSGGCGGSDGIADTPNQADATYNCPTFPLTDACSGLPNGIMFMNYMDYTDDVCMNLFTKNQCTRMEAALNNDRASLQSSPAGCQGIEFELDASVSSIVFPTDTLPTQGFRPRLQLTNKGRQTLQVVRLHFQVDGQPPLTFEYHTSLPSLASTVVELPLYFTGEGGHIATAWCSEPNNGIDEFPFNDTATTTFMVKSTVPKNTVSVILDPNGVTDRPWITIQNPSAAILHLRIFNMMGQLIAQAQWPIAEQPSFQLDFSAHPRGLYVLQGEIGYDTVQAKLMIVP